MDVRQIFSESSRIKVKSARPDWIGLSLPSTTEARNTLMGFVRSEISNLPGDMGEQVSLAVDELLRNSIEHGCRDRDGCLIDFTLIRTKRVICFQIRDNGPGFSMDEVEHAAINNPPQDPLKHAQYRNEKGMRPGGFGILLVREIADELLYNEAGNEVMLVKYLNEAK